MHTTNHIVTASNVTRILVILHVGGKSSGIFGESEPPAQPQRSVPPGGSTSNIFGSGESAPVQSPVRSHPNKPKVGHASRFFNPLSLCRFFEFYSIPPQDLMKQSASRTASCACAILTVTSN